jgi:hypothetical protein
MQTHFLDAMCVLFLAFAYLPVQNIVSTMVVLCNDVNCYFLSISLPGYLFNVFHPGVIINMT